MKSTFRAGALFALMLTAAACGGSPSAQSTPAASSTLATHNLAVTLTLTDDVNGVGGEKDACYGVGAFSDIQPGVQVTVKDGQGSILAFADFVESRGASAFASMFGDAAPLTACIFTTTVRNVPDVPIYSVTVGSRDAVNHTREELLAANWSLQLSTGITR